MIVTCAECTTSFQLDESRIPATGARVRCSRCKHAFFLEHPSASAAQVADSIAEAAVSDPTAGVPPVDSEFDATTAGLSAGSLGAPQDDIEGQIEDEIEEEEWQFSEEVRVEGDDEDVDAPDALDGDDFGLAGDFGGGLDEEALSQDAADPSFADSNAPAGPAVGEQAALDDGSGSGLELDAPGLSSELDRDESSFGSVDDFSSLMEDEEPAPVDLDGDSEAMLERPSAAAASVGSYSGSGPKDDLGDPESWDLVGGDRPESPRRPAKGPASKAGSALEGALAELSFSSDEQAAVYPEDDRAPSAFWSLLARAAGGVGWVVTLVLVGVVATLALRPEWTRWAQVPLEVSAGPIRAETTHAGWVETTRAGFVLVFEGQVENRGGEAVRPGAVQLALLDGSGARLVQSPLSVGFPLAAPELRESDPGQLRARSDAAVRRFQATPLAPGETRPFEVIVMEAALPERARRVLLEVAAGSQGRVQARAIGRPESAIAGTHELEGGQEIGGRQDAQRDPAQAAAEGGAAGHRPISAQLDLDY